MGPKVVVTVRLSATMKADLQKAADEKGGNMSAEILHRLADYQMLRRVVEKMTNPVSG